MEKWINKGTWFEVKVPVGKRLNCVTAKVVKSGDENCQRGRRTSNRENYSTSENRERVGGLPAPSINARVWTHVDHYKTLECYLHVHIHNHFLKSVFIENSRQKFSIILPPIIAFSKSAIKKKLKIK